MARSCEYSPQHAILCFGYRNYEFSSCRFIACRDKMPKYVINYSLGLNMLRAVVHITKNCDRYAFKLSKRVQ